MAGRSWIVSTAIVWGVSCQPATPPALVGEGPNRETVAPAPPPLTPAEAIPPVAPPSGECVLAAPNATTAVWPVHDGELCQRFGVPVAYQPIGFHTGIDVCGALGAPVYAIGPGRVVHVGWVWSPEPDQQMGPNAIIVDHGSGIYSVYAHNDRAMVRPGDCVVPGLQIATAGNLGLVINGVVHVHLELLVNTAYTGRNDFPFTIVDPPNYTDPLVLFPSRQ